MDAHNECMSLLSRISWGELLMAVAAGEPLESSVWYPNSPYGYPGREALALGGRVRTTVTDGAYGTQCPAGSNQFRYSCDSAAGNHRYDNFDRDALDVSLLTSNCPVANGCFYSLYNNSVSDYPRYCPSYSEVGELGNGFSPRVSGLSPDADFFSSCHVEREGFQSEITQQEAFGLNLQVSENDSEAYPSSPPGLASMRLKSEPRRRHTSLIRKRPSRGGTQTRDACARSSAKHIGVTMRLRTLLRKLLAGSGWIMHSGISKQDAKHLIGKLLGQELVKTLQIPVYSDSNAHGSSAYEHCIASLLPMIMTYHTGTRVTEEESEMFIIRDKGPYHLTDEFLDILNHRTWPPSMPSEDVLRAYKCYREGEASKDA